MSGPANEAVLDLAVGAFERRGLGEADAYLEDAVVSAVSVADGQVESVEHKGMRGLGVRVIDGGRVGFAHTTDLSPEGIEAVVARAAEAAPFATADDVHRLPEPEDAPDVPANADGAVPNLPETRRTDIARRIEAAARAHDPRVRRTRESTLQDVAAEVLLGRAGGFRYRYAYTRVYGWIDLVAEEGGDAQSGAAVRFAIGPDGLDPEAVGREAARRAVEKLGGRPCTTRRVPVLLVPEVVDGLLEELASIFFADEVLKGKSLLAGLRGERVASGRVTLVDDGRLPGGCNAAPVDGEGVATRRVPLIREGVLEGYLHTGFSAVRMGEAPTGNAARDSWQSVPATGNNGLMLLPTGESLEDLRSSIAEGLRIDEVMGLHTIDPISGDFSLGASGRALRDGEAREPVAGIAVAGNVRDLLAAVAAVADDVRAMPSGNACSSVLLEGLAIGGEGRGGQSGT